MFGLFSNIVINTLLFKLASGICGYEAKNKFYRLRIGGAIFPTFIVIDRGGKIIFSNLSEGLAHIKDIVLK
ncbi:hypothetical protein AAW12_09435 [Sphingobacterium sp. Ag1]|nr:hypothetical protein AAW12_09435 [Sphingobacterium sp. Ag1]